jgi:hypothetical protein
VARKKSIEGSQALPARPSGGVGRGGGGGGSSSNNNNNNNISSSSNRSSMKMRMYEEDVRIVTVVA